MVRALPGVVSLGATCFYFLSKINHTVSTTSTDFLSHLTLHLFLTKRATLHPSKARYKIHPI